MPLDPAGSVLRNLFALRGVENALDRESEEILRKFFEDVIGRIAAVGPATSNTERERVEKLERIMKFATTSAAATFREWRKTIEKQLGEVGATQGRFAEGLLDALGGLGVPRELPEDPPKGHIRFYRGTNPDRIPTTAGRWYANSHRKAADFANRGYKGRRRLGPGRSILAVDIPEAEARRILRERGHKRAFTDADLFNVKDDSSPSGEHWVEAFVPGDVAERSFHFEGSRETSGLDAPHLAAEAKGGEMRVDITPGKVTVGRTRAILKETPFRGKLLKDWADGMEADTLDRIKTQMTLGLLQAEEIGALLIRVRGRSTGFSMIDGRRVHRFTGGVWDTTTHEARAVIRTSVNFIANRSHVEAYKANADVLSKLKVTATLDARTSEICMALDGKETDAANPDESLIPPFHWNCRTVLVPIVDWDQFGVTPPPGKRASMFGPVDDDETYDTWFRKQSDELQNEAIGRRRANLFRKHGMNLSRLIRSDRSVVRVGELEAALGLPKKPPPEVVKKQLKPLGGAAVARLNNLKDKKVVEVFRGPAHPVIRNDNSLPPASGGLYVDGFYEQGGGELSFLTRRGAKIRARALNQDKAPRFAELRSEHLRAPNEIVLPQEFLSGQAQIFSAINDANERTQKEWTRIAEATMREGSISGDHVLDILNREYSERTGREFAVTVTRSEGIGVYEGKPHPNTLLTLANLPADEEEAFDFVQDWARRRGLVTGQDAQAPFRVEDTEDGLTLDDFQGMVDPDDGRFYGVVVTGGAGEGLTESELKAFTEMGLDATVDVGNGNILFIDFEGGSTADFATKIQTALADALPEDSAGDIEVESHLFRGAYIGSDSFSAGLEENQETLRELSDVLENRLGPKYEEFSAFFNVAQWSGKIRVQGDIQRISDLVAELSGVTPAERTRLKFVANRARVVAMGKEWQKLGRQIRASDKLQQEAFRKFEVATNRLRSVQPGSRDERNRAIDAQRRAHEENVRLQDENSALRGRRSKLRIERPKLSGLVNDDGRVDLDATAEEHLASMNQAVAELDIRQKLLTKLRDEQVKELAAAALKTSRSYFNRLKPAQALLEKLQIDPNADPNEVADAAIEAAKAIAEYVELGEEEAALVETKGIYHTELLELIQGGKRGAQHAAMRLPSDQRNDLSPRNKSSIKLIRERVADATEWFNNSISSRWIVKDVNATGKSGLRRAHYRNKTFKANGVSDVARVELSNNVATKTAVHEFAHMLEYTNPRLPKMVQAFWSERTKNERPKRLQDLMPTSGYGSDEITKADDFFDPYVGKIYDRESSEIVSMGMGEMWAYPVEFANADWGHFQLIYEIMRGSLTLERARELGRMKGPPP